MNDNVMSVWRNPTDPTEIAVQFADDRFVVVHPGRREFEELPDLVHGQWEEVWPVTAAASSIEMDAWDLPEEPA